MRRSQIFKRQPPPNWSPVVGTAVVVAPRRGTLSMQKAVGTIADRLILGHYLVRIRYQRHSKVYQFHADDLRPLPADTTSRLS